MPLALRLALRELRGGLAGFRVFLVCLTLGVAGIAAVGSITEAIRAGLAAEGRAILGGDIAITYTYRFADPEERRWMREAATPRPGDSGAGAVSETVDLRSMIGQGEGRALAQVKGIDDLYPLYGELRLAGGLEPAEALARRDGLWGLVTEPVLAERLGLEPGDQVQLGPGTFAFRGTIEHEPDRAGAGFALGPRVIAPVEGLREAGLLGAGTLFEAIYRLKVPPEKPLPALKQGFEAKFADAGARWRDRRASAPGIERFVSRLGSFLTLVGLAALVVGGVGVGASVRGYLRRKVDTIATLRTLGAPARLVFRAYLVQIAIIAGAGIALGLAIGGGGVAALGPWMAETLPLPARFTLYPRPLLVAALFGMMTALLFTLWPLTWLREVRPAELFRGEALRRGLPRPPVLAGLLALSLAFGGLVVALSEARWLALWVMLAIGGALVLLRALGWALAWLSRRLAHSALARRRPALRLALGAIGGPRSDSVDVVMALGLGLGVLAAIGQVDANMQRLISDQLPKGSPAFFFVDIQPEQLDPFRELVGGIGGVGKIDSAAMLRGVITTLDGQPAREVAEGREGAWVVQGDRGVSYADEAPDGTVLTEGAWWEPGHDGEPQLSFIDEEGRQLGLEVGSTVTVNILGRPITARIANFREVEWQGLGINFVMIMNEAALAGAPHTHIATVYAPRDAEAEILNRVAEAMPNVTAIGVREQVSRVTEALGDLGAATRWGALAVLLTGLAVLIGAAGAAAEGQVQEAAVLKVLGAERRRILGSFALRAALLGAGAGVVALGWGALAAWAVTTYVLEAEFALEPLSATGVVAGGAALNLLAGLMFALRPLRLRPARVLRMAEG